MTNGPRPRLSAALASKAEKVGDAAMSEFRGRARLARAVVRALGVLTVTVAVVLAPMPAYADPAVPIGDDGAFSLSGAGFGHGIGMSQYGAYGAAVSGRTWPEILAFYYPGTARSTRSTTELIQVWLEGDQDRDLRVRPSAGLRVSDNIGTTYTVPVGSGYRSWRAVRSVTGIFKLQYLDSSGSWVTKGHPLSASPSRTWRFTNTAKLVEVRLTDGSSAEVRGSVAVFFYGSGTRTVNRLRVETYLRSVVPSEMPTSWHTQAVRTQAVAARTYAFRALAGTGPDSRWDICAASAAGLSRLRQHHTSGTRTVHETTNGNRPSRRRPAGS